MKRCGQTTQLTAFLLGDLPGQDALALAEHLAACEACRAKADELGKTLALLREAFPADAKDEPQPVLDAARREALLAVRPSAHVDLRKNWFTRRHPKLLKVAAEVVIGLGLFGILSASLFPAVSSSARVARKTRDRMALDLSKASVLEEETITGVADMQASAPDGAAAPSRLQATTASGVARRVESAERGSRRSSLTVWDENGKVPDASAAERLYDGIAADKKTRADAGFAVSGSGRSTAPAPSAKPSSIAAVTVSGSDCYGQSAEARKEERVSGTVRGEKAQPAPAAFGIGATVKSPVTLKGVFASRSQGTLGTTSGVLGGALAGDGKRAVGTPESDVPVEFFSFNSASLSKQDATASEVKTRLKIEVPKPQFTGTPKDIRSPNLEAAGERSVGPYTRYRYEAVSKEKAERNPEAETRRGTAVLGKALTAAGQIAEPRADEPAKTGREISVIVSDLDGDARTAVVANKPEDVAKQVERLDRQNAAEEVHAGAKIDLSSSSDALPVNPFVATAAEPFSTFAMDVDTASYTLTRQALRAGALPDPARVRVEEIVNAFDYGDAAPERSVFRVYQDGAQSPFGAGLHLLRVGVKGRRLGREEQRPAMLTFVIDVSGSMSQPDRIGFARLALTSLLEQLAAEDRIQLIAYSDHARLVLEPVPASEKARVLAAFEQLQCNGSTNLEEGMRQAYEQAVKGFVPGAENRVILLSDGVANLGADSAAEILAQVASNRKQGITCSVFGVGAGTYNDRLLEELANKGDGVYRFLDTEEAVRTAFVDDLAATLNTIAKDAKIQVEWNPAAVRSYRLLGYENRALAKEQFRDDAVDAGEVGSGQSVTALYELELAPDLAPAAALGAVRIRYQRVDMGKVEEVESALASETVLRPAHAAGAGLRVAACAAEFAELLRGSPHAAGGRLEAVADFLRPAALELSLDTRVNELLELVTAAAALKR